MMSPFSRDLITTNAVRLIDSFTCSVLTVDYYLCVYSTYTCSAWFLGGRTSILPKHINTSILKLCMIIS